jgi:hypothetical protein
MKIHRTIATAATMGALTLGLAISATGTANASDRHTLIVRMENMHLTDDESNWDGPFESRKDYEVGNYGPEARVSRLTHSNPRSQLVFSHCVGGEVRGLLVINLQLQGDDQVAVNPILSLYEGTSCSTNDLDGTASGKPHTLPPGSVTPAWFAREGQSITARNTDEGGIDSATANYIIRHLGTGPKVLGRARS